MSGRIFMLRECAQSIPRLEKPKNRRFSHKNPKMFDFRFNTPIPSLNQGQSIGELGVHPTWRPNPPSKFSAESENWHKSLPYVLAGLMPAKNLHKGPPYDFSFCKKFFKDSFLNKIYLFLTFLSNFFIKNTIFPLKKPFLVVDLHHPPQFLVDPPPTNFRKNGPPMGQRSVLTHFEKACNRFQHKITPIGVIFKIEKIFWIQFM